MSHLHVCVVGQQFSFRPDGAPLEERSSLFQTFRYGDSPDAVLISYGAQGTGYFVDLSRHWGRITEGVKVFCGYVWPQHVPVYARLVERKGWTFSESWRGHPYGLDGPEFVWITGMRP